MLTDDKFFSQVWLVNDKKLAEKALEKIVYSKYDAFQQNKKIHNNEKNPFIVKRIKDNHITSIITIDNLSIIEVTLSF